MAMNGMDFAKKELKKRGWKRGKGLGKQENGISDAIKVNLKMDGSGLGFDHGEQFTFRWWDHMFSSTLNKLDVEEDEHGDAKVKAEQPAHGDSGVSSKRVPPKFLAKEMLYGRFVRGTPTTSAAPSSSSSDSDSSDDDRPALMFEDDDEKMRAACGGRTAHKGARHGMGLSAKLARLEQQEADFLNESTTTSDKNKESSARDQEKETEKKVDKKRDKKRDKKKRDKKQAAAQAEDSDDECAAVDELVVSSRKRKKNKQKSKHKKEKRSKKEA
ncbi:G patch domain-containing protein 4-like [Sycon ciliatum]|uniref:G patch domain-containing protein 4-like n=1 Tax=Sycon ciliatum TaxID=27933 RepID=UPI0020AD97B2|eukprot:scpid95917/ scgid33739/ G patch domain-containing protein 4